jgi:hypothetical protein
VHVANCQRAGSPGEPGRGSRSRRGKSGPPARVLPVTPSPGVIRATASHRVSNQLFLASVAIAAAPAMGRLRTRFRAIACHGAQRSLAPRLARGAGGDQLVSSSQRVNGEPAHDGTFRIGLATGNDLGVAGDTLDISLTGGNLYEPELLESRATRAERVTFGAGEVRDMCLRLTRGSSLGTNRRRRQRRAGVAAGGRPVGAPPPTAKLERERSDSSPRVRSARSGALAPAMPVHAAIAGDRISTTRGGGGRA